MKTTIKLLSSDRALSKDRIFLTYIIFCVIRVVLVFIPQNGFIHPDEFFQSVEPMAGDEFNLEVVRTWEFKSTFPIRSIALPIFLIKLPYNILRFVNIYSSHFFGLNLLTSYTVLIVPRLAMCALSFVNDFSLYRICKSYGLAWDFRLLILASSYVTLVFGSRTFTNTIETVLVSLLLCIVAECMLLSHSVVFQNEQLDDEYEKNKEATTRARIVRAKSALPSHTFNKCFLISTICVAGVFNRPTFLAFALPVVFFWILRGMGSRSITFVDFNFRILLLSLAAIPALLFFTLVDSLYYNYLTLPEVERLEIGINNFVFTPLNFVKYNLDPKNTAQHGEHPWYLHVLVNVPLLFNVLGVAAIGAFLHTTWKFSKGEYRALPRVQSVVSLMMATAVVPVAALSCINHQEPRFLIPILLPVILLHAPKLQSGMCICNPFPRDGPFSRLTAYLYDAFLGPRVANKYLKLWYISNIVLTIFFGFLHQGGVVPVAQHFNRNVLPTLPNDVTVHLVTSHVYNVPMSLLFMPSSKRMYTNPKTGHKYTKERNLFLHEHGGMNMTDLHRRLKLLMDINEYRLRTAAEEAQKQDKSSGKRAVVDEELLGSSGSSSNNDNNNNNKKRIRKYKIFLAIPATLSHELNEAFYRSNTSIMQYRQVKVFYPHLSTEAWPSLWTRHPCEVNTDFGEIDSTCDDSERPTEQLNSWLSVEGLVRSVSSIVHQFGLVLYQIHVNHPSAAKEEEEKEVVEVVKERPGNLI